MMKSITKSGANRRLVELSFPDHIEGFDKNKWKLDLALHGIEPTFDDPIFIETVCSKFAWKFFSSSKTEKLRDLVCQAIFSKIVDFSNKAIDNAFASILPEIILNESDGKNETAKLFEAIITYAPEKSRARILALRLNKAFGFTCAGFF